MPRPSSKKLLVEVRAKLDAKEYDEAITLGENVIKIDPSNYHAHVFIGVAAVAKHNCELALQTYQRAIDLRPELPLAYKGIVQTLGKPFAREEPLLLARAHFGLGSHSPDHAGDSLPRAAETFFSLAVNDAAVRDEALAVLRAVRASSVIESKSLKDDQLVHRICKLLSLALGSDGDGNARANADERLTQLQTEPLSSALDDLSDVLIRNSNSNSPEFFDSVADLVVERAVAHCVRNNRFEDNLAFLRRINAKEALLQVAQLDHATQISAAEIEEIATSAFELDPSATKISFSRCLVGAKTYIESQDIDAAVRFIKSSNVTPTFKLVSGSTPLFYSYTHAIVKSFFHLIQEEFKLCVETAKAALALASQNEFYIHMQAYLSLLLAAGLHGDRKHKDAIKTYGEVRKIAQQLGNDWMDVAANCGLVRTAILAHGRRSRNASSAMEEACASSSNTFGVLEYVWSDALSGDIDIERMSELALMAVKKAKELSKDGHDTMWVCKLLDLKFSWSNMDIAVLALTRLGQMVVKEGGYSVSTLTTAQKHHMEAAGLVKGLCDPFAHLGFIFEQLGKHGENEKMKMRAIRCYERAVAVDAAHPVASRRLARMLHASGMTSEAAAVARRASDRNLKARWAFSMLGWWRHSLGKFSEAAVAFQSALRGTTRLSAKEEDALFGTDVGVSADDNDLLVDIDSWRGLGFSYRAQGKVGAACACLDDACGLLEKPPAMYTTRLDFDIAGMQQSCRLVLQSERSGLFLASRRVATASRMAMSIVDDVNAPRTVGYHLAEAYVHLAAEEWVSGCYRKASGMRESAGDMLNAWIARQLHLEPNMKYAPLLKRLGDIWMEAAGECPTDLALLMPPGFVEKCLSEAFSAYSKACQVAPSETKSGKQDLAAVMLRMASFHGDESMARKALDVLLDVEGCDSSAITIGFLTLASVSSDGMRAAAKNVAIKALKGSGRLKGNLRLLYASIALQVDQCEDVELYADAAVRAARADPTDWRAWLAVGKVREVDAQRRGCTNALLLSCEDAYAQADGLGAGPAAVCGRLRCLLRRVAAARVVQSGVVSRELYADSAFALALACRVGVAQDPMCVDIADCYNRKRKQDAIRFFDDYDSSDSFTVLAHVHMFPFVPVVSLAQNGLDASQQ